MPLYFSVQPFSVADLDRHEPRFSEIAPNGLQRDWRRLSDINLKWLEKTLQNAIQRPSQCEERLGLGCLFYFHLLAILENGPDEDLRTDLFGKIEGSF